MCFIYHILELLYCCCTQIAVLFVVYYLFNLDKVNCFYNCIFGQTCKRKFKWAYNQLVICYWIYEHFQRQLLIAIFLNRSFKKFCIIWNQKETLAQVFPVSIAKFLRTASLQNSFSVCFCIFLKVIKHPFRKGVNLMTS